MILILLASGRGKRLKNISKSRPKCLTFVNDNQTIMDHTKKIFHLFKKVIIVTGYKSNLVVKSLQEHKNVKFVKNKDYKKTNMVTSMCLSNKYVNDDVIISYTDILYSESLIKRLIKSKKDIVALKKNWFPLWRQRFGSLKNIKNDAENIIVKKGYIFEIGTKIKNKLPKYQYMGILRFSKNKFKKICKIYSKYKDKNVSMTDFLNFLIQKKRINFNYISTTSYWFEIDNKKDLFVTRKLFHKN